MADWGQKHLDYLGFPQQGQRPEKTEFYNQEVKVIVFTMCFSLPAVMVQLLN